MRRSKRRDILDAAIALAVEEGPSAMTLEGVADRAGVTRGGMMYHFVDRDALDLAVQERLAEIWEERLQEAAGGPPDQISLIERTLAYAEVALQIADPGENRVFLEAVRSSALREPWKDLQSRWVPSIIDAERDEDVLALYIAKLAADGMWADTSLVDAPNSDRGRGIVLEAIRSLAKRDRSNAR
ncbi:TetR/AcrR family transcriptional regulator [Leucobacter allii]|uniref:TetR/AcrR family transcriptional regulator n=1 Tax=Leucobacter allii TaxID=2932247 RepID=UPI001FD21FE6|nr:TetR/AcrR family transcriptional regulator [Leucobacter allii]UOR01945.1 TetR/AcrR family transcriptional regulator [Leucobacter allii]